MQICGNLRGGASLTKKPESKFPGHAVRNPLAYVNPTLKHAVDRGDYTFCRLALHDVTTRPGTKSSFSIQRFVVHRENNQSNSWKLVPQFLDQIQPGLVLQGDVD